MEEYDDKTRLEDLHAAIEKGNNKSALHPQSIIALQSAYTKEVEKGWMLPVRKDILHKIPGISVIPIGCEEQNTINEKGETIKKRRTTHDCSQALQSGFSVNNAIDKEDLDECLYGFCLLRILHNIHHMRNLHPNKVILMNKTDLDAAFRRLHVVLKFAILCTTIIGPIAYILFRLPFGSSPAPSNFCLISEFVIDLAQMIAKDPTWNPRRLFNPNNNKIPPPEVVYDKNRNFSKARPLAIKFDYQPIYIDGFVDDLITVVVTMDTLIERATNVVPLAIHSVFRPLDHKEPIHRDDILSERKMKGEGALSEVKQILGWTVDSRRFIVSLSTEKEAHWQQNLNQLIQKGQKGTKIKTKELESMIGKLNHTTYLFNEGRFFLSRLRRRLRLCKKYNQRTLHPEEIKDLIFWKKIIKHMKDHGRSINHITYGIPQIYCVSDASKFGIGGFNSEGMAWRWQLPEDLHGFFSLNLLEFLAARITLKLTLDWLEVTTTCPTGIKVHSITDSASALSWMRSANFDPVEFGPHDGVARQLATDLLSHDCSLFLSHIPGKYNVIADALSRDFHLSPGILIKEMYRQYGNQMPANFRISKLKDRDISWIYSLKPSQPVEKASDIRPIRSKMGLGVSGAHSSNNHNLETAFWREKRSKKELVSSLLSRSHSDIITLGKRLCLPYGEIQSEQPSTKWARPSERMVIPTLRTMQ